jgi:hypothetical protein
MYHPLTTESGSDSPARRAEADKLLKMIDGCQDFIVTATGKELQFVQDCHDGRQVTTKMLFWLRDIKDKYCL